MRIADRASVIREKHKIKTPDAIHLATAILYDVDEMQTMDGWHEDGKRDGLLALSGNVAEYKLLITQPYPRVTPPTLTTAPPEPLQGVQDSLWKDLLEEELESEGDEQNGNTEENNELKADSTHSPAVPGGDGGRIESEAPSEREKEPTKEVTAKPCECGCGEYPKDPRSRFLPGHDLRKAYNDQKQPPTL